jgi:hypothetical protein
MSVESCQLADQSNLNRHRRRIGLHLLQIDMMNKDLRSQRCIPARYFLPPLNSECNNTWHIDSDTP